MRMSVAALIIASLGSLASVTWLCIAIATIRHRKKSVWLVEQPDASQDHDLPELAVLIAARNEAANIGRTLKSILDQNYPDLTIIVVNDRSSDETGAIAQSLAIQDPRLRVVQVDAIPVGWLGKTNALELAAHSTTATWLLLTDADVIVAPGTLRRAVVWSIAHDLDHLTVVPKFVTTTIGERVFLMLFGLSFAVRVFTGRVDVPERSGHLGIGAFNLVRADALRKIGGFDHIKLSVDDDNRLAEALKANGGKAGALFGVDAVSVHWQVGLNGLVLGMEKNYFAILNFRIGMVILCSLAWLVVGVSPFVGLFIGSMVSRVVCTIGIFSIASLLAVAHRQTGIGWYYVGLFPLCVLVHIYSLSRSTLLTLSKGGVNWRSNHYDLKDLRAHVQQRDAWLNRMKDTVQR